MDYTTYRENCFNTLQYPKITADVKEILFLKLTGELGETSDLLGKILRSQHLIQAGKQDVVEKVYDKLDNYQKELPLELGDVWYYLAILDEKPEATTRLVKHHTEIKVSYSLSCLMFHTQRIAANYAIRENRYFFTQCILHMLALTERLGYDTVDIWEMNHNKLRSRYAQ